MNTVRLIVQHTQHVYALGLYDTKRKIEIDRDVFINAHTSDISLSESVIIDHILWITYRTLLM